MSSVLDQLVQDQQAEEARQADARERADAKAAADRQAADDAYGALVLAVADDPKIDQARIVTTLAAANRKPTELARDVAQELERRKLVNYIGPRRAANCTTLDELRTAAVSLAERRQLKRLIDSEPDVHDRQAKADAALEQAGRQLDEAKAAAAKLIADAEAVHAEAVSAHKAESSEVADALAEVATARDWLAKSAPNQSSQAAIDEGKQRHAAAQRALRAYLDEPTGGLASTRERHLEAVKAQLTLDRYQLAELQQLTGEARASNEGPIQQRESKIRGLEHSVDEYHTRLAELNRDISDAAAWIAEHEAKLAAAAVADLSDPPTIPSDITASVWPALAELLKSKRPVPRTFDAHRAAVAERIERENAELLRSYDSTIEVLERQIADRAYISMRGTLNQFLREAKTAREQAAKRAKDLAG